MSIARILIASLLVFGATQANASSDGTDSQCVVGKNRTLFNQCDYAVDVSFCVENPQQTKNFFDSSDAFKCPNGGLSTLEPGKEEGNILNGTVHWFACSTKHRGTGSWRYVAGSGYSGICTTNDSSPITGSMSAETKAANLKALGDWAPLRECTDLDGDLVRNAMDPSAKQPTCRMPSSAAAKEELLQRIADRKRVTAAAAQLKRNEAARAEQLKQEEIARVEQQFRNSLQTMNAGQLFARADELSTGGDPIRAREVQRTLISRFPNHPLAATAARQMAGESGGSPAGGTGSSATGAASGTSGSAPVRQAAFSKESSRYSSVCMRNAAKAEQATSAAKAKRYFGGAVDLEIFAMIKRIAQPCMAYDAKAKWSYDDAEQALGTSECRSGSCSRWLEGEPGAKTRQWFEIFSGEFNKMMANWEGYSRDMDPPGSISPPQGAGAQRSAAGRLSSQQCEALKQAVVATKIPSNAAITSSQETLMWMTSTGIQVIDAGCAEGTPREQAIERQRYQQAYAEASQACNQVQAGGRQCVSNNHFGPGAAPEAGIRSPYPNIPVGSVPKVTRLP